MQSGEYGRSLIKRHRRIARDGVLMASLQMKSATFAKARPPMALYKHKHYLEDSDQREFDVEEDD